MPYSNHSVCLSVCPSVRQQTLILCITFKLTSEPKAQVSYCHSAPSVNFFSETAERNSTKLDRMQDLNVLYQVCVFRADRKNKIAARRQPLIGLDILDFFSEINEQNSTKLDRKQDLNVLYQVCFFGQIWKTKWPPWPLIGWDIFDFSEIAERNSTKLYRKQDLNVFYQVCVIGADRKNKMATQASDWLRHFRILLWNRWTEFNETWQEANS